MNPNPPPLGRPETLYPKPQILKPKPSAPNLQTQNQPTPNRQTHEQTRKQSTK